MQEESPGERRPHAREAPSAGDGVAVRVEKLGARRCRLRVGDESGDESFGRSRPKLRVLVEKQAKVARRLAQQGRVVLRLADSALQCDQADIARSCPYRLGRAIV